MALLLAHRGSHRGIPENTLAAFRRAIEEGADGVELDARPCASGEVVVSHDPHLGRVAGRAAWVALEPFRRLARIDLGGGERVALLDEAIDLVVGSGRTVNVEVKGDVPDRHSAAKAVARCLERRRSDERSAILLSTFDPVVLAALRHHVRDVPIALLFDEAHTGLHRAKLLIHALRPDGLHPHHPLVDRDSMRRWTGAGRFVSPWTVNDPQRARWLAALGVHALITDDVPALRTALD